MTIGVCIWVLVDSPSFADFLDVIDADVPIYRTGAIILIVVSCVVFLLTLFGCVGASRESKCILGTVGQKNTAAKAAVDWLDSYLDVLPNSGRIGMYH